METVWKANPRIVATVSDKVAPRLGNSPRDFLSFVRAALKEAGGDANLPPSTAKEIKAHYVEYISAIATELNTRRHISEARRLPDAPAREATSIRKDGTKTPATEQLGFPGEGFKEKAPSPDGWPVRRRAA